MVFRAATILRMKSWRVVQKRNNVFAESPLGRLGDERIGDHAKSKDSSSPVCSCRQIVKEIYS
jgi:hypothetical protein